VAVVPSGFSLTPHQEKENYHCSNLLDLIFCSSLTQFNEFTDQGPALYYYLLRKSGEIITDHVPDIPHKIISNRLPPTTSHLYGYD
jgi:hypothetical protein